MTLIVRFTNPYSAKTVKELLEEDLLIPRKIRHFLREVVMRWLAEAQLRFTAFCQR